MRDSQLLRRWRRTVHRVPDDGRLPILIIYDQHVIPVVTPGLSYLLQFGICIRRYFATLRFERKNCVLHLNPQHRGAGRTDCACGANWQSIEAALAK